MMRSKVPSRNDHLCIDIWRKGRRMDNSIKNEAPAETRAPIGDLMANIIIEIDGLKELKN